MCQRLFPHSNKLYDSPFGAMWGIIEPGEISKIHGHHEVETSILSEMYELRFFNKGWFFLLS